MIVWMLITSVIAFDFLVSWNEGLVLHLVPELLFASREFQHAGTIDKKKF